MRGIDENSVEVGNALRKFRTSIQRFTNTALDQSVDAAKAAHKKEILDSIEHLMKVSLDPQAATIAGKGAVAQGKGPLLTMLKTFHDLFGG